MRCFIFLDRLTTGTGKHYEFGKCLARQQNGQPVGPKFGGRLIAPTHFVGCIENEHWLRRSIEGNLEKSQGLPKLIQEATRIGVLRSEIEGQGLKAGLVWLGVGTLQGAQCCGKTPNGVFGFLGNNIVLATDHGSVVADRGESEGVVHDLGAFRQLEACKATVVKRSELLWKDLTNGLADQGFIPTVDLLEAGIELDNETLGIGAHEGEVQIFAELGNGSRGPGA